MTHVAAVNLNGTLFLLADSAVTQYGAGGTEVFQTAFRERSDIQSGKRVDQGAIKIAQCGRSLIAFAGNLRTANRIVDMYSSLLSGRTYEDAFRTALASHGPFEGRRSVSMCCAFDSDPVPRMLLFNLRGTQEIEELEPGQCTQFGSAPDRILSLTHAVFSALGSCPQDAQTYLALALAGLQRNGPADYLMPAGVGGPYAGAYLDSSGVHWQKDTLWLLYSSSDPRRALLASVATFVRDERLVAVPARDEGRCAVFCPGRGLSDEEWVRRNWPSSVRRIRAGHIDYVAYLDMAACRVTVIHMDQRLQTDSCQIFVEESEFGNNVSIGCVPTVNSMIFDPLVLPMPLLSPNHVPFALHYVPSFLA